MPIFLPPLRERKADLPELVKFFINKFSKKLARLMIGMSPDALAVLQQYRFPGNIRELENLIERAFIVENSDHITANSLPEHVIAEARTKSSETQISGYKGPLDFDSF